MVRSSSSRGRGLAHALAPTLVLALAPFAAACGGGAAAPPPVTPSTPVTQAEPAKKGAGSEDASASRAAAIEALTTGEAKSGTCDEAHKAALEKLLAEVEIGMKDKAGEDGKPLGLQLVGKRVLALGAGARSIEMSVTGRGTEVHVLAFGVRDVSLDVLVGNAAATTLRSPFQRTATLAPPSLELPKIGAVKELQSDSRQVAIKPGQPLVVKLSGQGCAGLVSFIKP
jgi:hypothetical protein